MKTRETLAAALIGVLALATTDASAQVVNTRIGPIETENGFPSADAAKKLFDESEAFIDELNLARREARAGRHERETSNENAMYG